MDEVVNNIKDKLSTDSLVEMMKNAKIIDDDRVKEDDVRKTLDKLDICNFIHTQELAEKLNKITEEVAVEKQEVKMENSHGIMFSVIGQSDKKEDTQKSAIISYDETYIQDNITAFLD